MSRHTIDLAAVTPAPEVCALQKALEALEAAEVDLYPRDVQPTHVVRNRIQFAAFVLRRHLAQTDGADSMTPNVGSEPETPAAKEQR